MAKSKLVVRPHFEPPENEEERAALWRHVADTILTPEILEAIESRQENPAPVESTMEDAV